MCNLQLLEQFFPVNVDGVVNVPRTFRECNGKNYSQYECSISQETETFSTKKLPFIEKRKQTFTSSIGI